MKKSKHILAVIIGILFVGAIAVVVKSKGKEEYKIISTIKSSFDTYESVDIKVIVNIKKYDPEKLMYEICEQYWELNENTDEIVIRLFNGKKDHEAGNVYLTQRFFKEY